MFLGSKISEIFERLSVEWDIEVIPTRYGGLNSLVEWNISYVVKIIKKKLSHIHSFIHNQNIMHYHRINKLITIMISS